MYYIKNQFFYFIIIINFYNCFSHLSYLKTKNFDFYYRGRNIKSNLAKRSVNNNNEYQLTDTIFPLEYNIKIVPYFEEKNFTFYGETIIILKINENTDKIAINSVDLDYNISTIKLQKIGRSDLLKEYVNITNIQHGFGNNTEEVIIETETVLKPKIKYKLMINYTGIIDDNMLGFYRSWYTDENGELRWIGTTQLQSTFARSVFPCFDEPRFKTPFTIQIARHNNMSTVSNMPILTTSDPDPNIENRVWDTYEKSPPMSTYLVGFCIFDFISVKNENITVWVEPNLINQTDLVINKSQEILNIISEYTAVPYSLPKMELIGVPDSYFGAMENWGVTTYREDYLLYDPDLSTAFDLQYVLSIVAHEFSHQWFGNLVTPEWWSYVWLNEGFATYFQYYVLSQMDPDWNLMDQFVIYELQMALEEDSGFGHPMTVNVQTPKEIEEIFDVYIYSKGAAIIRMVENIVGSDNFKVAVQNYLENGINRSGGVVTPKNLWTAFEDIIPCDVLPKGISIKGVMSTWTDQDGFPLITVQRDYNNKTAKIKQEQFFSEMNENNYNKNQQWFVPLTYMDKDKKKIDAKDTLKWLWPKEEKVIDIDTDDWILFNLQEIGYYRVNYDTKNWKLLTEQLLKDHTLIHPINRAQLINDAFKLSEIDKIGYDIPISLSKYLVNERDYIPWFSAMREFGYLLYRLYNTTAETALKEHVKKLITPLYQSVLKLPFGNRTHIERLLMNNVLFFSCNVINLKECEKDQFKVFNDWVSKKSSYNLDPDVKAAVLCTGIRLGSEKSWNHVWNYFKKTKVASEKYLILEVLGCSMDRSVIYRYLSEITASNYPRNIRQQDYEIVFESVTLFPRNTGIALNFLAENYKELTELLGSQKVKTLFFTLDVSVWTENYYSKIKDFYDQNINNLDELKYTVEYVVNSSEKRVKWKEKYNKLIEQQLSKIKITQEKM